MYIINLTYKTSLDQVEALLAEHISWLKQGYEQGFFIASGRKNPRVGGVILAKSMERAALDEFLRQDPFQAVANYDITDFQPSMATEAFSALTHI